MNALSYIVTSLSLLRSRAYTSRQLAASLGCTRHRALHLLDTLRDAGLIEPAPPAVGAHRRSGGWRAIGSNAQSLTRYGRSSEPVAEFDARVVAFIRARGPSQTRRLARAFGASMPVVQRALARLRRDGFVETSPIGGFHSACFSSKASAATITTISPTSQEQSCPRRLATV